MIVVVMSWNDDEQLRAQPEETDQAERARNPAHKNNISARAGICSCEALSAYHSLPLMF